jgi:hypothetical protein
MTDSTRFALALYRKLTKDQQYHVADLLIAEGFGHSRMAQIAEDHPVTLQRCCRDAQLKTNRKRN